MFTIQRFLTCEKGATSIEYAFIAFLISIALVTAVTGIGTKLRTKLTNVSAGLS